MVQTIALGTAVDTGLAPNACRRMNGWPDRFYQRERPSLKKFAVGGCWFAVCIVLIHYYICI